MNRADRRLKEKYLKERTKHLQNKAGRMLQKYTAPCCYVNSQPVYSGACVFLKKDTEITGQYNWKLNKLIEQGHRFVIQAQEGKVGGSFVVSLLSTSYYLNEEQKLGIRLSGKYHNNKYVYMDAKNSYVIKPECIKSVDYNLNKDDRGRCLMVIKNNKTDLVNLHKGLLDDKVIDKAYDYFIDIFNVKLDEDQQHLVDVLYIRDYVMDLPYEIVKIQLGEEYERHPKIMKEAVQMLKDEHEDLSEEMFDRKLLMLYLATTDDLNITKVSEIIQRGY